MPLPPRYGPYNPGSGKFPWSNIFRPRTPLPPRYGPHTPGPGKFPGLLMSVRDRINREKGRY